MEAKKPVISVFKTSVTGKRIAASLRNEILLYDKITTCNFDLMDCDNILRLESTVEIAEEIISFLNEKGFRCEELV